MKERERLLLAAYGWLVPIGLMLMASPGLGQVSELPPGALRVEGTFAPLGPPMEPPVRVDAGGGCIVDVRQSYAVAGDLSGRLVIDFRILVRGPCGSPPGTFEEQWIALGRFEGELMDDEASTDLTYVAEVSEDGIIEGEISLGSAVDGRLRVQGSFAAGEVSYEGWVRRGR